MGKDSLGEYRPLVNYSLSKHGFAFSYSYFRGIASRLSRTVELRVLSAFRFQLFIPFPLLYSEEPSNSPINTMETIVGLGLEHLFCPRQEPPMRRRSLPPPSSFHLGKFTFGNYLAGKLCAVPGFSRIHDSFDSEGKWSRRG